MLFFVSLTGASWGWLICRRLMHSHALLSGRRCLVVCLPDNVWILQHCVVRRRQWMVVRDLTRGGISSVWASEKENKGLWLMNFVMNPPAGLLYPKMAPLLFVKQPTTRHVLVNIFRQEHMPVLVVVILILFWVLDLVRKVWHFNSFASLNYKSFYFFSIFKK